MKDLNAAHSHERSQIPSLDAAHHCSDNRASPMLQEEAAKQPNSAQIKIRTVFKIVYPMKNEQFMLMPHSSFESYEWFPCFPSSSQLDDLLPGEWNHFDMQAGRSSKHKTTRGDATSPKKDECLFHERQRWSKSKTRKEFCIQLLL